MLANTRPGLSSRPSLKGKFWSSQGIEKWADWQGLTNCMWEDTNRSSGPERTAGEKEKERKMSIIMS